MVGDVSVLDKSSFVRIVREERLFCSVLAHLLMQGGSNLTRFMELVRRELPSGSHLDATRENAEVYVEFTFLRDYWSSLGPNNEAKRRFILSLLARVDGLRGRVDMGFPDAIPEFNALFMGSRGRRITKDIVYPGQWSVLQLNEISNTRSDEFRDFCRFKWAFNIKPDIVVLLPGSRPLCIEAKLESKEGVYPANIRETQIFDERFGQGKGRVRQIDLQKFMFEVLLGEPCHIMVISRDEKASTNVPCLTWRQVFSELDVSSSIPFVRRLVEENQHLGQSA
jgi:hypothetical protein